MVTQRPTHRSTRTRNLAGSWINRLLSRLPSIASGFWAARVLSERHWFSSHANSGRLVPEPDTESGTVRPVRSCRNDLGWQFQISSGRPAQTSFHRCSGGGAHVGAKRDCPDLTAGGLAHEPDSWISLRFR